MTEIYVVDYDTKIRGRRETGNYEIDANRRNKANIIDDMMTGQYEGADRIFVFDPDEKTSSDVSADIALEILAAALNDSAEVPQSCVDFIERHLGCEQLAIFESERAKIISDWKRQTTSIGRTQ